jgi:hypothetical protein
MERASLHCHNFIPFVDDVGEIDAEGDDESPVFGSNLLPLCVSLGNGRTVTILTFAVTRTPLLRPRIKRNEATFATGISLDDLIRSIRCKPQSILPDGI